METLLQSLNGGNEVPLHKVVNQVEPGILVATSPNALPHQAKSATHTKKHGIAGVGFNKEYEYPKHGVSGQNATRLSKSGTVGNSNGGYGVGRKDYAFKPEANLTEAQEIAMSSADVMPHFIEPEHYRYVDRTKESMLERIKEQAEDYNRKRIEDMLAKGFTEEEIKAKLDRERLKAIDNAEKAPSDVSALITASIEKSLPDRYNEDFAGTSISPGAVALKQNPSSYQLSTDSLTGVQRAKKFEAERHEARIRKEINPIERPIVEVEHRSSHEQHKDLVSAISKDYNAKKQIPVKHEERVIHEQKETKKRETAQEIAMRKMFGEQEKPSSHIAVDHDKTVGSDLQEHPVKSKKVVKVKEFSDNSKYHDIRDLMGLASL